jgi:hypothetical protein
MNELKRNIWGVTSTVTVKVRGRLTRVAFASIQCGDTSPFFVPFATLYIFIYRDYSARFSFCQTRYEIAYVTEFNPTQKTVHVSTIDHIRVEL